MNKDIYQDKLSHLCSLEGLSEKIGSLYAFCPERFELNNSEVKNIQEQVVSGCYRLSPVRIMPYTLRDDDQLYTHSILLQFSNNTGESFSFIPEESDKLVLSALGASLNEIFYIKGYDAIRFNFTDFYDKILTREECVESLYKLDLTRSLTTINLVYLKKRLESILGNNLFFDFVLSFLNNEYVNTFNNIEYLPLSIPPAGLLTNVLLNLEFSRLDYEISELYPDIYPNYRRHTHEVYIYNCSCDKEITSLLNKLNLEGDFEYIKPGTHTDCFLGQIGLTNNGQIYVKYQYPSIE